MSYTHNTILAALLSLTVATQAQEYSTPVLQVNKFTSTQQLLPKGALISTEHQPLFGQNPAAELRATRPSSHRNASLKSITTPVSDIVIKPEYNKDSIIALGQNRTANNPAIRRIPVGTDLKNDWIIDDGSRIMGCITGWSGGAFSGIASLRPVDGVYPESISTKYGGSAYAAFDGRYYYSKKYRKGGGICYDSQFYVYDTEDWSEVKHLSLEAQFYTCVDLMTYNPHDGKIWGVCLDGLGRPFIGNVNTETGLNEFVGQTMFTGNLKCMTFTRDGICYGLNGNGELVTLDLQTCTTNIIAPIFSDGIIYTTGLVYDDYRHLLYAIHNNILYSIDPITTECNIVSVLPSYFTMAGLYMKLPQAADKAPDTVADISVSYISDASTQSTLSITAPDRCFDGSSLAGQLTMQLYVDGNCVTTQIQEAGSTINIDYDFLTPGTHELYVIYNNEAGESPRGTIRPFCGVDTPTDVTNIQYQLNDQTGDIVLTWDAVTAGIHGGYVDLSDITYSVVRMPDNVTIAEGLTATTLKTSISKEIDPIRYHFEIKATSGGINSDASLSESFVFGKALDCPVRDYLGSDYFTNLLTTVNADGTGDGFYGGWGVEFVNGGFGREGFNDKWCYTPAIHLKAGNYYYNLQHQGKDYELFYGLYRTPESQREHLIGTITKNFGENDFFTGDDMLYNAGGYSSMCTYKRLINIEEEGDYYFAFHWNSPYQMFNVGELRLFEVKEGPLYTAPQACKITDTKTFPKGELKNNITFNTPAEDYLGNKLTNISKVEFYLCTEYKDEIGRSYTTNDLVYTLTDNVEPNRSYTCAVPAHQGNNLYYVYAYNENGIGGESECVIWAGIDYPGTVENPEFEVIENRDIIITWEAPSEIGQNGGYVNPDNVRYSVGVAEDPMYGLYYFEEGLKQKNYTFYGELGEQYMFYYGVTPTNSLGEGISVMAPIVIGTPYKQPFAESFDFQSGSLRTSFWNLLLFNGSHSWYAAAASPDGSFTPADNDGAMLVFAHEEDQYTGEIISTPIMSITDVCKPKLGFSIYHNASNTDTYAGITVYPVVNDEMLDPIASIGLYNTATGWKDYEIDLTPYLGQERVCFYFYATSSKARSILGLDNIRLFDDLQNDLAITSLVTPAVIAPNEDNLVTVTVQNRGRQTLDTYKVGLFANGVLIAETTGRNLQWNGKTALSLHFTPSPDTYGTEVNYEARVLFESDENTANNSQSRIVNVKNTALPMPTEFAVSEVDDGIKINWQAPATPLWEEIREDFESYEPYIINNIGEWTVIDNDQQLSVAPNDGTGYASNFANNWCAKSFQVWTPDGLTLVSQLRGNAMKMYGDQCLISFCGQGYYPDLSGAGGPKTDDWLISPRVAGGTRVAFYAKQVEDNVNQTFEFLVSYGTQQPQDFGLIATETLVNSSSKKFEYTLPADAHYFAIRNITEGGFALMIDNINYTPGFTDLELIGYNVYCNGTIIATMPAESNDITVQKPAAGTHIYGVTAVYDYDGESAMATASITSLKNITADVCVTADHQTIVINGAQGSNISIFSANGTQVNQLSLARCTERVNVQPGAYMVKIDGRTFKVIVK